jgi:hypothetical protein
MRREKKESEFMAQTSDDDFYTSLTELNKKKHKKLPARFHSLRNKSSRTHIQFISLISYSLIAQTAKKCLISNLKKVNLRLK